MNERINGRMNLQAKQDDGDEAKPAVKRIHVG